MTRTAPTREAAVELRGKQTPELPAEGPALARGAPLGRYVVLDRLGEGGMGQVYAAFDPELGRRVALKLVRAEPGEDEATCRENETRLVREAQAMARLSHPNVVAVFDVGLVNGRVFLAMELVDGVTAKQWFGERPRSWREVLQVFREAGRGLAAAHAAGLIHRDFKPSNVMVSSDGRVRVGDFGLARTRAAESRDPATSSGSSATELDSASSGSHSRASLSGEPSRSDEPSSSSSQSSNLLETPLTHGARLLGTPGYMAPEQYLGRGADAKSDQYAFCVSLWEALYGRRPFRARTREELAALVLRGVPVPPRGVKVPKWLRRILLRGLSVDPSLRFENMEALLTALSKDPASTRRRLLAAASVAAALAASVLLTARASQQQSAQCRGGEAKLAALWNPETKQRIERVFLDSGRTYAASAFRHSAQLVDAFAARWAASGREACEATWVRKEQSNELLDLRTACLDAKLHELKAVLELYQRADAALVERSVQMASGLGNLAECADLSALTAPVRPPAEPKARAEVAALRNELASLRARIRAARLAEVPERLAALLPEVDRTGYAPLRAELLELLAYVQGQRAEPKGSSRPGASGTAEETLSEAVASAYRGRYDELVARTAAALAQVVSGGRGRAEEGVRWMRLADAAVARLEGSASAKCDVARAWLRLNEVRAECADAGLLVERAARACRETYGEQAPETALVHLQSGTLLDLCGGEAAAVDAAFQRARDAVTEVYGPRHPMVGTILLGRGGALVRRGAAAQALPLLEEARDLYEESYGVGHFRLHRPLEATANAQLALAHGQEALALSERALRVLDASHRLEEPVSANARTLVGRALLELRRPSEAVPALERAVVLAREGALKEVEADAQFALARALWESGAGRERARKLAAQLLERLGPAGSAGEPRGDGRRAAVERWLATR